MYSTRRFIALIAFLITLCFTAYMLVVVIPSRLAKRSYEGAKEIAKDIRDVFNFTPEVKVDNTIVLQQQTEILQLATLAQQFRHEYNWTNTWLGSTKKINIKGTFEAKAGFDLQKKFQIVIDDDKAIVKLPSPEILSLESIGEISFEDESGVWNWVNEQDRSAAITAFNADAKRYAEQSAFLQSVRFKTEDQLKKIMRAHDKEVEFRYDESLNSASEK
jgi:hypothetical protein